MRHQKGFSLIEVLVALTLMSGVLASSAHVYLRLQQQWQSVLTEQAVLRETNAFLKRMRLLDLDQFLSEYDWQQAGNHQATCLLNTLCEDQQLAIRQIADYQQNVSSLGAVSFNFESELSQFSVKVADQKIHFAVPARHQ